jgi:hypothetical protein
VKPDVVIAERLAFEGCRLTHFLPLIIWS